jgi:hypothetical protein
MSRQQKCAWFTLAFFAVATVVVVALLPWLGIAAFGASGLVAFSTLGPLLFRKKRGAREVAEDERDRMIAIETTRAAGMGSYTAMILACMIPWFVHMFQGKRIITIHALPWIVFTGMFAFILGQAIMTLVLYGRGGSHDEA